MKLIDRRKQERDEVVADLATSCDYFLKAVNANLPLHAVIMQLAYCAERAKIAEVRFSDLDDVEKYGPGGGR